MCFSATASFTAGAALAAIGAVSVTKAANTPQRVFAAMPLIFSVQQMCEGVLWLSLMHAQYSYLTAVSKNLFLFFAQVVWPVYVPLIVLLLEKEKKRRQIARLFLALGILIGGYLLLCLLHYPTAAIAEHHHIHYEQDFPLGRIKWWGIFYIVPAATSFFISSLRPVRLFGAVIILLYVFTRAFYAYFLISVWCYFAAVLSLVIFFIIAEIKKGNGRGSINIP